MATHPPLQIAELIRQQAHAEGEQQRLQREAEGAAAERDELRAALDASRREATELGALLSGRGGASSGATSWRSLPSIATRSPSHSQQQQDGGEDGLLRGQVAALAAENAALRQDAQRAERELQEMQQEALSLHSQLSEVRGCV